MSATFAHSYNDTYCLFIYAYGGWNRLMLIGNLKLF